MAKREPVVLANRDERISLTSQSEHTEPKKSVAHDGDGHDGTVQDYLLNSVLAHIIPMERGEAAAVAQGTHKKPAHGAPPAFSVPVMTQNFRRFNARIGVVFAVLAVVARLFSWKDPTHTLSFMTIWVLVCLNPALIPAVPMGMLFFYVMIPSFLARHPPPPNPFEEEMQDNGAEGDGAAASPEIESAWSSYAYNPYAVAPAKKVEPASSLSQDFMRNMGDLQNAMGDFADAHDHAVNDIGPYVDFSDEYLSSAVFLSIFLLMSFAALAGDLVPYRYITAFAGVAAVGGKHPLIAPHLAAISQLKSVTEMQAQGAIAFRHWADADIVLDAPREEREVEIFELQRRTKAAELAANERKERRGSTTSSLESDEQQQQMLRRTPSVATLGGKDADWEPWLYSPSPHDPLSPHRLTGEWPTGTQFFEDVAAPPGWRWRDARWTLDALSAAWVEERSVTGVEVEGGQAGAGWVYDIDYESGKGDSAGANALKSWEEIEGRGKQRGEWRRRRWVRVVEQAGA